MTTIVWDGKTLAADGRCTASNRVVQQDRLKIFMDGISRVRGSTVICYAVAGAADMESRIGQWIAEGCPVTDDFEACEFEAIIITEDSAYVYYDNSNDLFNCLTKEALGSGYDFAHSALTLKMDAVKAVKHAASIDIFSGGEGAFVNCRSKKPMLKRFTV